MLLKDPQYSSSANALFWEDASVCRWGKYISQVEERHIRLAHELSGETGNAVEIGAEGGRWSKMLSDLGWKLTCTDVKAEAVEICQSRIPEATCIHVDREAQVIPCETGSQRLILCIEVHEVLEADWFKDEAVRVLEAGGLLVGVCQNRSSIRGTIKTWFPKRGDSFPHYKNSYSDWRRSMVRRGFSFVQEEGICWMPFSRFSNSRLVPAATLVERALGLRRLVRYSPWVVSVARKS